MRGEMIKIVLGGVLGRKFGRFHYRQINTTSEAIKSLCCTIEGFEKFLIDSKDKNLTYAIFKNNKNIGMNDLNFPVINDAIRILPVVIGSKKSGFFQTILGAVLVVVGAIVTGLSWGLAAPVGGALVSLGCSLAIGGVIQMLSPQMPGLASKQATENKPSYAFGGVTNTAAQGYPLPLLYDKRRNGEGHVCV